jgi:GDPmannose 4,6-dehydratase
MWKMLGNKQPDDFVVATGVQHSLRDFVERAFQQVGLSAQDHVEFDACFLRPDDITHSVGDASKARRALDWRPRHNFDWIVKTLVNEEMNKTKSDPILANH